RCRCSSSKRKRRLGRNFALKGYESETLIVSSFYGKCDLRFPLFCGARCSRQDPLFFLEHFPSGSDSGRDSLIKAQSGLRSVGNYPRLQRGIPPFLIVLVQILSQGG